MKWLEVFFAAPGDLLPGIRRLESVRDLKYVFCREMLERPDFPAFNSLADFPDLGFSRTGDVNTDGLLLIMSRSERLRTRKVRQRRGKPKYTFGESDNPSGVTLSLGGMYRNEALIAGSLATLGLTPTAQSLFREFSAEVLPFGKIDGYWVGPQARLLGRQGLPLLKMGIRAAEGYEFKLPPAGIGEGIA